MHIPDGYLSFQTSLPILGTMIPLWSVAINKVKQTLSMRQIPLLSLCAAFSFVIMMFNIPVGPSSVHAVGAVFIAVLLGPWPACIAVSIALIIQAVMFGDGGIWAIGANCFNIAFAMPFTGYFVYKLIKGKADMTSKRGLVGIFAGSYVGINAAALLTSIEFGIQPILFKTVEGTPLYGFYPLSVSVPAMMFEHMLIAGPIEAVVTVTAISYLAKFSPQILDRSLNRIEVSEVKTSFLSRYKAFIVGLIVLVITAPVGLLATGTAWGEWGTDEVSEMIGFVPEGLKKLSENWNALIPDYTIPGLDKSFMQSSVGYIASAVIGIVGISLIMFASSKFIAKKEDE
ncbi:MAG: cobalt transporter CbiM [Clostridia bacterium]|nr:cobalt transporter CbiM [Clostridia bacterium]